MFFCTEQGRIQDFKLGGASLKKIAPSRGRRENFWGISCEKSRFYAKNHIFSNCGGRRENFWGISCEKSRFYAKKSYFFPILGGGHVPGAPPPLLSTGIVHINIYNCLVYSNKVKYTNMLIYYIVLSKSM